MGGAPEEPRRVVTGTRGVEGVEAVVLDVLGTLVDEPGGLRAAIREVAPSVDEASVEALLSLWQRHVAHEQRRIAAGRRPWATTTTLDGEAARRVADGLGLGDPHTLARLATASRRLPPWHDSVDALARLSRRFPVLALSHADHTALLGLNAHAGLRWHQALSAETVRAYKPAPEVYRLAVDTAGMPPARVLMVAAHAWDLRGARAVGMSTAHVSRPVGDPPCPSDDFDLRVDGLHALATALGA
ncbi:haloacid dehalogenase type II [Streptomyces sedi]|uniref:Haloacid dehalogenase type II n=1 Tax=Streptomyces sedi TaxID=555059 RepID=A0A5C4V480_9ACTN|nr:haloacid dehalogenase type II [Streptomyces sedi]TNM30621.1 haloacid dehalogenase type II [Streptomyces sedi]